mgnify:CR=1 FL=1
MKLMSPVMIIEDDEVTIYIFFDMKKWAKKTGQHKIWTSKVIHP